MRGRVIVREDAAAVENYLPAADAGLYTSENESFGLSILETLFFGKPVVAFRIGGIPEVVGDAAYLHEFGDIAAMASSLDALVESPDAARKLGERGRAAGREVFYRREYCSAVRSGLPASHRLMASRLNFRLEAQATGSRARAATFRTLHNEVQTPLFMPVGTQATVKAQLPQTLEDAGSQILLANTYHLLLRPGPEVFRRTGGIHGFMSWKRSVLTDSGGFQIFSLPHSRAMSEEGAVFQSYLDGKTILLSPEVSIETQKAIGSDIMMALDQCIASTADEAAARAALGITHRWAARSLAARGDSPQSMFGIVQGALFQELRRESAARLSEMPFDGFAIGGLAVGEGKSEREDVCEFTAQLLPDGQTALPHGRRHAARYSRSRPSRRRHVRLHHADAIGAARRRLHLARISCRCAAAFTNSPRRSSIRPAPARPARATRAPICITSRRRARRSAGSCSASTTSISTTSSCARSAQSILADSFLDLYREKRAFLHESDLRQSDSRSRSRSARSSRTLGNYEVHMAREGFASIRQISSGEIMHSRTPPMEEAQQTLHRAIKSRRARPAFRERECGERASGHLGCRARRRGQRDGGDPLLRRAGGERSGASAANHQLRKRSRFAPARLPAQP